MVLFVSRWHRQIPSRCCPRYGQEEAREAIQGEAFRQGC